MAKWIVVLSILSYTYASAQQDTSNFRVTIQDDSLIKVLRQFIQVGQSQGLSRDGSIIVMSAVDENIPLKAQWKIFAINATIISLENFKKFIPAYVSEFDSYSIVVYFPQNPSRFFGYPKSYLDYLAGNINVRLQNKSSSQQLTTGHWHVTFTQGDPTIILIE
ncbi:hypothetical protein BH09BAC4_BH09BAC4_44200 [soil metagenome]